MKAIDFEYDGYRLSDFGYIICQFDSKSAETVSNGSQIKFNTTPILHGAKHLLTDTEYDECLETTFCICKNPCNSESGDVEIITLEESRQLTRWLNRKEFCEFRPIQGDFENIYVEGSFNINNIKRNGDIVGLELHLTTNRPFALHRPIKYDYILTPQNRTIKINDISDEIGYLYPDEVEITCAYDGNLIIHNSIENRDTVIKNCQATEVITLKQPIITTSLASHKIQNDFNFNFLRIANTFRERMNVLTFSMPCRVKIKYTPIRKVGL